MWQIVWDPPAAKEFDALSSDLQERVLDALYRYTRFGEGNVKYLQGRYASTMRLRVGEYRIRFRLSEGNLLVVLAVRPRGSAYKD